MSGFCFFLAFLHVWATCCHVVRHGLSTARNAHCKWTSKCLEHSSCDVQADWKRVWKYACLASNTPQEAMLWPAQRTSSLFLRSGEQLCSVLGKIQMWIVFNSDVSFSHDNFNGWLSHEAFLPGMTCLYGADKSFYFACNVWASAMQQALSYRPPRP